MVAKGWRRPDGEWDISALHKKTGGSRRWLYRLVRGETNFGIDEYDRILSKAFDGLPFESILAGLNTSNVPRELQDLYDRLGNAIADTQKTGTLPALRFALHALADKAAMDRALEEKARAHSRAFPASGRSTNAAKAKPKKTGTE